MKPRSVVQLRNLGYHLPGKSSSKPRWLFRDVNLELMPGQVLGIVGPSGCGKTVLSYVLGGFARPSEGAVELMTPQAGALTPGLRRRGAWPVQLVFQNPYDAFNPHSRLIDYAMRLSAGAKQSDTLSSFESRANALGIHREMLERKPSQLSGGQCQRASIALALAWRPSLLVLDEPTSMLDTASRSQVVDALATHSTFRENATIIASHDFGLLSRTCDRLAMFHNNAIVEVPAEALRDPRLPGGVAAEMINAWRSMRDDWTAVQALL